MPSVEDGAQSGERIGDSMSMRKLVTVDTVQIEQQVEVANEALALPEQAKAIRVEDSETFQKANQFFIYCHQLEKKIAATFAPLKKATNEAHKAATRAEADAMKPVTEAKGIIKREMEDYN